MKWLSLSFALCLCVPARAGAQADVVVHVSACDDLDPAELTRLLGIELAELRERERGAVVEVRCDEAALEVAARLGPDGAVRSMSLTFEADEREALARLLALRVAELLASPEPPPPPAARPEPGPTAPRDDAPATSRPLRHGLSASFVVRRLGPDGVGTLGAALAYDTNVGPLVLASELSFLAGGHDASLSRVNVRDVGLALSASYRLVTRHVDVQAGPGVRVGYTFLSASEVRAGHRGRRFSAPWLGPFAALELALHGDAPWQGVLGVEAGYVAVPIRGRADDGSRLITLDGGWFSLRLGARVRF